MRVLFPIVSRDGQAQPEKGVSFLPALETGSGRRKRGERKSQGVVKTLPLYYLIVNGPGFNERQKLSGDCSPPASMMKT